MHDYVKDAKRMQHVKPTCTSFLMYIFSCGPSYGLTLMSLEVPYSIFAWQRDQCTLLHPPSTATKYFKPVFAKQCPYK